MKQLFKQTKTGDEITLKVTSQNEETPPCVACIFSGFDCSFVACSADEREDKKNVFFEIK